MCGARGQTIDPNVVNKESDAPGRPWTNLQPSHDSNHSRSFESQSIWSSEVSRGKCHKSNQFHLICKVNIKKNAVEVHASRRYATKFQVAGFFAMLNGLFVKCAFACIQCTYHKALFQNQIRAGCVPLNQCVQFLWFTSDAFEPFLGMAVFRNTNQQILPHQVIPATERRHLCVWPFGGWEVHAWRVSRAVGGWKPTRITGRTGTPKWSSWRWETKKDVRTSSGPCKWSLGLLR